MLKVMTRALIINLYMFGSFIKNYLYMFGSFIKNLAVCNLNTLVVIIDENEIKKKKKKIMSTSN